ncbi:MAG: ATP-binding protein [Gammaproteobacteria bacterium]|nr:ATP-binding protein [Gammaproteobacteria bacterium]
MPDYELKIDLNALNHLGLNLYSNVPAVLSELIANAWDADADNVHLDIINGDTDTQIIVKDDGCGMDETDINNKFLTVGYQRRKTSNDDATPKKNRKVMGRKGIGKLSVFSIANQIEIYTKKDDKTLGLSLSVERIRQDIEKGQKHYPESISDIPNTYEIPRTGTTIVLRELKKRVQSSIDQNLRKRIARRFSIWSDDFCVYVNNGRVNIGDRDYFHKLEYAWVYGGGWEPHLTDLSNQSRLNERENKVDENKNHEINGWIGLVKESGSLQDGDDNLNKLAILSRGKIASEDILEIFREGGLYTKYLIGEIEADFLDLTDEDDIATSSRQDFLRDDERFVNLRKFIENELQFIGKERARFKYEEGIEKAKEIPAVREWLEGLKGDARKTAETLFARINTIVTDDQHRKTLFKHGILAFEHLHFKEKLGELDNLNIENLAVAVRLFSELDDIEASWYYQITQGRLEIIRKFKELVDDNALEKFVQEHIHSHLWLLDPSWDRATETPQMEKTIKTNFNKMQSESSDKERSGRIDIIYKKSSGKHIIIELKRASIRTDTSTLLNQVDKYRTAVKKAAKNAGDSESVETICLVGSDLKDWSTEELREESVKTLQPKNIRVVTYQQLIREAEINYRNYLEKSDDRGRIKNLLKAIESF